MLRLAAACFSLCLIATPTLAEGPGRYVVTGKNKDSDAYKGTATLTQTGKDVWRLSWNIAGEKYDGFGIGDGRILAFTFSYSGGTGIALYTTNDRGGYDGAWAFKGETRVSSETLMPAQ